MPPRCWPSGSESTGPAVADRFDAVLEALDAGPAKPRTRCCWTGSSRRLCGSGEAWRVQLVNDIPCDPQEERA
jgi:hypothetical protein